MTKMNTNNNKIIHGKFSRNVLNVFSDNNNYLSLVDVSLNILPFHIKDLPFHHCLVVSNIVFSIIYNVTPLIILSCNFFLLG